MKKKFFVVFFILFNSLICFAQVTSVSPGEKLFLENKPRDAVILLEGEINQENVNPKLFNYLGLAYYQIGEYDKSVAVFAKGLSTPGTNKKILSFNQRNYYFAIKDYKNVLLTPHNAWGAYEARERLLSDIVENIKAFQNGEKRCRVDI
mgnify:CR=1 FL=1